ncbi:hypothetical protein CN692_05560 [Bacillus sp. AFS002410]|uniref:hypothetical protein n=1 Tax=Bacillus sp. AFS002410 TaxID=2033481 RepID=UPI000BF127C5|nr:hypothetical protein [Bacillus sp. AFS002410]PEJ59654.1 hypothetical protein CN692_05560 [Bacillus sp. AFS002410]
MKRHHTLLIIILTAILALTGCSKHITFSAYAQDERVHSIEKTFAKAYKQAKFEGVADAYTLQKENDRLVVETVLKDTGELKPLRMLLVFDKVHAKLHRDYDVHVRIVKSMDYGLCTKTFKDDGSVRGAWYNKCTVMLDENYHVNNMGTKSIKE